MVMQNGAQIMTSMPPPIVSSSGKYHSQWMALVRKVQVLLKKHDKTMKKMLDCECNLDLPLLFEFSLVCTVLEKSHPMLPMS